MCITPLMMLYYPFLYAAIIWEEQALNGIIIDKLTIMDAARQGWHLLRNNVLSVAIMALIIYFGIGMITGIVLMPVMMPFFILPFGFITQDLNWIIIAISILGFVVFIPLFAVLSGWSMTFTKSAWVLTYLRLTQKPQLQPLS